MSNVLKSKGKSRLGQMIENHLAGTSAGCCAWPVGASRPTHPPIAAAAAAGRATPGGAPRSLSLLPLGQRPFGFLAEAPGARR